MGMTQNVFIEKACYKKDKEKKQYNGLPTVKLQSNNIESDNVNIESADIVGRPVDVPGDLGGSEEVDKDGLNRR